MGEKDPLLARLLAAAAVGAEPAGPANKRKAIRIVLDPDDRPLAKGNLCAQAHGFNLHAATKVAANRYGHALAFDSDRGKIVLFGGVGLDWATGGLTRYADLWEWDPETLAWTNRTPDPLPASWPSKRQFATMVYDPGRKRVVLFGGDTASAVGSSQSNVAEVWEWDGSTGTWTNLTPSPLPVRWPGIRLDPGMAFASATGRLVLYGGHTNGSLDDLWWWAPPGSGGGGADGGVGASSDAGGGALTNWQP